MVDTIFRGKLSAQKLYLNSEEGSLHTILKHWVENEGRYVKTSLIIDAWIFLKSKTVLESEFPIFTVIKPYDALNNLARKSVNIDVGKLKKSKVESAYRYQPSESPITECDYEWENVPDYSYTTDTIDIPILIIDNRESNSVINYGISVRRTKETWFKMTVSTGNEMLEKLTAPSKVKVGDVSISKTAYFDRGNNLYPGEAQWVYIRGKLAHVHQKEYYVCRRMGDGIVRKDPTGKERMLDYVYSIQVNSENVIIGGIKSGLPPSDIMNWMYNGTRDEWLKIPDTALSDGILEVNTSEEFYDIFKTFDVYKQDFEVGIPVGAIIGALAGFPEGYDGILSGIMVTMSWGESASVYISGYIVNYGEYNGQGSNIPVKVYMKTSKYRYYAGTDPSGEDELFDVPAGIYFRFKPA